MYETKEAYEAEFAKRKKQIVGLVVTVLVVIFAIIMWFTCTVKIQPGYKGVKYSLNGGLQKEVLDQGMHFIPPWVSVTSYPISTETVYLTKNKTEGSENNDSFDINTSDGKSVNVDVTYSYHMEDKYLPHIFTKFRRQDAPEIEKGYIKTQLKTVMQAVSTRYGVLAIYAEKRDEATVEMKHALKQVLKKDGILLETFSLSDVRPDERTLESLQQIADAQNKNEFLKREQKNKEQQMINDKIDAENKKQVAIINAEATAQETQIKADAQAAANAKLQQSLTAQIIQDNWIKKWDGKVPAVQGGTNSLIQLPGDLLGK